MERIGRSKLNTQIHEEASEWFIEHRAGDLDEAGRREFDRWLRKSPEHLRTYLEIAAIWNEGPSLDLERKWDIDTLVKQAAEAHDNVVSLTTLANGADVTRAETAPRGPRKWRLVGIAASIAVCIAVGVIAWERMIAAPSYSTAVGEQRSIMLPDGSTVELNSLSKIKVRYSEHERAVELIAGQALFQVAKNQARPFIVTSGETRVRAVGTQFDVYKKRDGTIVTVLEGRVAILTDADVQSFGTATVDAVPSPSLPLAVPAPHAADDVPDAKVFLSSGEQLTVTPTAIHKAEHPNVAGATAWTQRQLVFDSASLTEVAEEFNRYNERRLVIRDAELYDFHISGVFSSSDPTSLIRFLRERPGVRVTESDSEIRVEKMLRENSQPAVTDS